MWMTSTVGGDAVLAGLFQNTTGVPAAGTAVGTDISLIANDNWTVRTANDTYQTTAAIVSTGLTAGTAYSLYWAFRRSSGTGTVTADSKTLQAVEI